MARRASGQSMHSVVHLIAYWALAFLSLGAALVLLSLYDALIGNDLMLHSARKEAALAGAASLIEGSSFWVVLTFIPMASRALVFPAVLVALLYWIAHSEDWNRFDSFMLLLFQAMIAFTCALVFTGKWQAAFILLAVFGAILAVHASIARSL